MKVLVDLTQINAAEALRASEFSADGVWAIELYATGVIDWAGVYKTLNAESHVIVEGNPMEVNGVCLHLGYAPDSMMEYVEGGIDDTILTDPQIDAYAGFGLEGNWGALRKKITVLSRSYQPTDVRRTETDRALRNPNVAGVAFEFPAIPEYIAPLAFPDGAKACLAAGKRCYLLMPPRTNATDYPADVVNCLSGFDLKNPLLYIVPAIYGRDGTGVGFLADKNGNPMNSIAETVKRLKGLQ